MPAVFADLNGAAVYPGKGWDAAALRRYFQPLRDRQVKAGSPPVYIYGLRAPLPARRSRSFDEARFLQDCVDIFKSWGWSYAGSHSSQIDAGTLFSD
jgi:hypothetical protein